MSFSSSHPSPHKGVTSQGTNTCLGADLQVVRSVIAVVPGEITQELSNFPHHRYSWPGSRHTAEVHLTVQILSGISPPFQRSTPANMERNCSDSKSVFKHG